MNSSRRKNPCSGSGALALIALLGSSSALSCSEDSVAIRYLSAIDAMDWDLMASFLADDAVYTDPTMTHYDRDAISLRGSEDIIAFWRGESAASGTSEIRYTVTNCLETAGYHAVNLDIEVRVAGEFWDVNRDAISIQGRVVSIIRVEDSRVIEHHDYVEYAAADRVVEDLRKQYGASRPE